MRNKKPTSNQPASFAEVVRHVHHEIVTTYEYCGRPMTRSDVNDYGSLCEICYMKEYYGL